jgi:hypothetical protein
VTVVTRVYKLLTTSLSRNENLARVGIFFTGEVMKNHRAPLLLAFVFFSIAPCFAHHVAVVVNKGSSVATITSAQLAKILLLEERKWPGGRDIVVVLHTDYASENLTLAHLCGMSSKDVKIFVASHKSSFTEVDSDSEVLRVVEATPGALGLVEVRSINDQVQVLKVDGKLPMEDGYLPH